MADLVAYALQKKLSENTYADIYQGITLPDKRSVIIKLAHSEYAAARQLILLQHEYRLLKQFTLPGIIQVRDFMQNQSPPVLVLENFSGISLQNYLANQPLNLEKFFFLALQMIDIISELHQRHIIHKDFRPINLLINPDTLMLKLTDLSIATQLMEETPEYTNLTQMTSALAYISPEQTGRMNRPIDFRTDFYSLGVTFFQMLTGELPFQTNDPLELIHYHIAKPAPLVTEYNHSMPSIVAQIVAKLLAKTPEHRYTSIVGLRADLQICAEQWRQQEQLEDFILGQHDIHDQLHISHQLYGREAQIKQLLNAFEQASQGGKELILIAGYSGIGKTSVVKEIHKPVLRQRGYFIQGKFDQLQQAKPYSALVTAFQSLVKQLLLENETRLTYYKQALLNALGNAGQSIIAIIPELALVIGRQPATPLLNSTEAEHRFHLNLLKFIRVFAQADHPLVIFLDDLQWADNASLKLIEIILQDQECRHLLLIGAYRDNEMDAAHPLAASLQHLQRDQIATQIITLQPLQLKDIEQLLIDTLGCQATIITALASCLFAKTQGNPFFINEFLKILYQKKLLYFSYERGQWQWDLAQIKQQSMMDNVIDLLTLKIYRLPEAAQETIKLASCIGHQFSLQTLATITEQSLKQTAEHLWLIMQSNLITPLEEANKTLALLETDNHINYPQQEKLHYRFTHDRVQQIAYQLIANDITQTIHLKIARLLIKEQPMYEQDERLFDILNHVNQSLDLVSDRQEKYQLAQYNLWAGIRAKKATAYQAARNYLQAGITLLSPIHWQKNYDLGFALAKELAICKYLTGEFVDAESDLKQLISIAASNLDKVDIYRINIQLLSTLNKHQAAIVLGLKALRLLNIQLPRKANKLHILRAVSHIKMQTGWRDVSTLEILPMQSAEHRAAADMISQLLNNAFICDQALFILLACKAVNISLRYGYAESTPMACLVYALTLMHALNCFAEGFKFVALYEKLKNQYGERWFAGRNHFALGTFIDPWRYPAQECLATLLQAQQNAYETGDIVYSNYCNIVGVIIASFMGLALPELHKNIKNTLAFIDKAKINDFQSIVHFYDYATQVLNKAKLFSLDDLYREEKIILASENNTGISFFYSMCTKLCYILGYFPEAQAFAQKQQAFSSYALGILSNFKNIFYYALSLTAVYQKLPVTKRYLYWRKLQKIRAYVQAYAKQYPANFQHYLLLLEAELNRLRQKTSQIIPLYEKAIKAAQEQKALQLVAIANECAGLYYLHDLNASHIAKYYFTDAYTAYKDWGALAKCQQLEQRYPQWFLANITHHSVYPELAGQANSALSSFDMLPILKSTQAISDEIHLDKLLQKLLSIVLESAGAERGVILIKRDDNWLVEAESDFTQQKIHLMQGAPANKRSNLPLSLINYVQRTQEPLILHQDSQIEIGLTDNYIQQAQPQSLLLMPLLYQGQLRRILYLENTTNSHVFTPRHLQTLQPLAAQAIISLENAYLYYQATHDPLTGLGNRSLLFQMFQRYANQTQPDHKKIALLALDIDSFKTVNNMYGHDIGDQALIHLAKLLKSCLREDDIAVRLDSAKFIIMLTELNTIDEVIAVIQRIYQQLSLIFIQEHEINISSSMGVSLFPTDGTDIQTLLQRADKALYYAKETGKNQHRFYSAALEAEHQQIHLLAKELCHALEHKEFCLYYQPIFNVQTGELCSLEALLRWQHPKSGLITAANFIESAEKNLLIEPIGKWVLETACHQAKSWQQQGLLNVPIAVNISAVQFKKQLLSELVAHILQNIQLDPKYIELELTETAFLENNETVLADSRALQALGIHLVLDDFGMGYSNLSYLKRLPISKLKIDRSFIPDNSEQNDSHNRTIIEAITAMAHRLGLHVIAEGVENVTQLNFLHQQQVDAVQGYYLSHPLSAPDCERLLMQQSVRIQ